MVSTRDCGSLRLGSNPNRHPKVRNPKSQIPMTNKKANLDVGFLFEIWYNMRGTLSVVTPLGIEPRSTA